jgi:creatinine amidohydrolase
VPLRHYCDYHWPELQTFDRDSPVLLPMGHGLDPHAALERWGKTDALLLPPLAYGWPGSLVETPAEIFRALVRNLIACLREDGWQNTAILCGEDPADFAGLGAEVFPLPRAIPLDKPLQLTGRTALLPLGHVEQHAFHLPYDTDTRIIEAIARRAHALRPDSSALLPALEYGASSHRRSFFGTLSAGSRAYEHFLLSVIEALAAIGCERIYLMNGHGGNHSHLVNVIKAAGEHLPDGFWATSFLYLSGDQGIRELTRLRRSRRGGMGHACELETALMLHIDPARVQMDRAVDEPEFIATQNYYMEWIEGGALIANPPWEDDTSTGAYGTPTLATRENGAAWLEAAAQEKAQHIDEIKEQFHRRRERRNQLSGNKMVSL